MSDAEIDAAEAEKLEKLEKVFADALRMKDSGRLDDALEAFNTILTAEPRLAEPRMELARILLDTDRLQEAEEHARLALEQLEAGGQWVDDISEEVVMALCCALLAEVLRRRADEDNVIFGDPAEFKRIVEESQVFFQRASALDPSDEYSSYHAFFLGPEKQT